jgi:hypothetical protein
MKKSNIFVLLIGLSVVLFLAIICVVSKKMTDSNKKDFLQKEIELSDFSIIVGEPHSRFEVTSGKSNKIIIGYAGTKDIRSDFYKLKNDTLYFLKPSKSNDSLRFIVQCESLKTINIRKGSVCSVAGFMAKILTVNNNDGQLIFGDKSIHIFGYNYWVEVEQLNVIGDKGKVLFQNTMLNSAHILLKHAKAEFLDEVNIGYLNLQLSDNSNTVQFYSKNGNIRNTNFKADATSKFQIYKN